MIPEIGHFALVLAFAVALVQGSLPMLGAARGRADWMALARPAAVLQFVFILVAFLALMQAYVVSDFTVLNVVRNSHSTKPMLYKISGVWGNHEGSMLLWVLILALFGAAVALFGRNLPATLRARVLGVQAWIALGFLAFTLLTSVHAFATDPERGLFILLLLCVAIGGSLTLFAVRAPALRAGGLFAPVSPATISSQK